MNKRTRAFLDGLSRLADEFVPEFLYWYALLGVAAGGTVRLLWEPQEMTVLITSAATGLGAALLLIATLAAISAVKAYNRHSFCCKRALIQTWQATVILGILALSYGVGHAGMHLWL